MSLVKEALEGIAKGATKSALDWFFSDKEKPISLPEYDASPLEMGDIYETLSSAFRESKVVNIVRINDGRLGIVHDDLVRYIADVRFLYPTHQVYSGISINVDNLHVKNRTMLWNFGRSMDNRHNPFKAYKTLTQIIDSLTLTGRARIYEATVMRVDGLYRADVIMMTGSADNVKFFEISFICDSINYDFTYPGDEQFSSTLMNGRYYPDYDIYGKVNAIVVVDKDDPRKELMVVKAKYLDGDQIHFRIAEAWVPGSTYIPESIINVMKLRSAHGLYERVDRSTGKTTTMYNCIDVDRRQIKVSVTY